MTNLFRKLFVAEGISKKENFVWILATALVGIGVLFSLSNIITGVEWLLNVHY
ncbi:hypothetical protein AAA434_11330 [Lactobacillus crispatus]|uniref:hypothetical protein n=1 Tax=Lactobacillus crispatus TaxID=47770 RepID=UPI0030F63A02